MMSSAAVPARPTASARHGCDLGEPTAVIVREGDQTAADGRLLVRFDVQDGPTLDGRMDPPGAAYRSFRADLRRRAVNTDSRRALSRSPTANNRILLAHSNEWIRPATCLERKLYGLQYARMPDFDQPTEFAAFVLSSADGATLRIYWYSVNRNGIGNASPLTVQVNADVRQGWRLRFLLHSHPFKRSDDTVNGIISPSEPDAQLQLNLARSSGLPEARITNGADTVRIPAFAFVLFDGG